MKYLLQLRRWWRSLFGLPPVSCEPNVLVGYEDGTSEVLSWMCGDEVCRCGGLGKYMKRSAT